MTARRKEKSIANYLQLLSFQFHYYRKHCHTIPPGRKKKSIEQHSLYVHCFWCFQTINLFFFLAISGNVLWLSVTWISFIIKFFPFLIFHFRIRKLQIKESYENNLTCFFRRKKWCWYSNSLDSVKSPRKCIQWENHFIYSYFVQFHDTNSAIVCQLQMCKDRMNRVFYAKQSECDVIIQSLEKLSLFS